MGIERDPTVDLRHQQVAESPCASMALAAAVDHSAGVARGLARSRVCSHVLTGEMREAAVAGPDAVALIQRTAAELRRR